MSETTLNSSFRLPGNDSFPALAIRYLDDSLPDDELASFYAAMESDSANVELFVDMCLLGKVIAESPSMMSGSAELLDATADDEFPSSGSACPPSVVHIPLHHPPRHGRLFLLGLAGGVSGGNGDFRDRAADRLLRACVPSAADCRAIVSCPAGWMLNRRWSLSAGLPAWSIASGLVQAAVRFCLLFLWATSIALASGLMEITYDTGAKVILQGPVTYEVESANGGFLSVGKLTARLEKKMNQR